MFNIVNKEDLIQEIISNVLSHHPYKPNTPIYLGNHSDIEDYIKEIAFEISKEVVRDVCQVVIREIISRLYTHSEFEQDLGLRG